MIMSYWTNLKMSGFSHNDDFRLIQRNQTALLKGLEMNDSNNNKKEENEMEATILNKECCYAKNSSIISRVISGEVILVPIRKNVGDLKSVYTLNKSGARIWELIDGKRKISDIKHLIVQEYDVEPEKAEKDVLKLFEQLKEIDAIINS